MVSFIPKRVVENSRPGEVRSEFDFKPEIFLMNFYMPSLIGEGKGFASSSQANQFHEDELITRLKEMIIESNTEQSLVSLDIIRELVTPDLLKRYYEKATDIVLSYAFISLMGYLKDSESISDSLVFQRFRNNLQYMSPADKRAVGTCLSGLVIPDELINSICPLIRPVVLGGNPSNRKVIIRFPNSLRPSPVFEVLSDHLILQNGQSKRLLTGIAPALKAIGNFTNDNELVRLNTLLRSIPGFSQIPPELYEVTTVEYSEDQILSLNNPVFLDYEGRDIVDSPTRFQLTTGIYEVYCKPQQEVVSNSVLDNVIILDPLLNQKLAYPGLLFFGPLVFNINRSGGNRSIVDKVNGMDFKLPVDYPHFLSPEEDEVKSKKQSSDWRYAYLFMLNSNSDFIPVSETDSEILSELGITSFPIQGLKSCSDIAISEFSQHKIVNRTDLNSETLIKELFSFLGFKNS